MSNGWSLSDAPSQAGKRFFVTGGNSGVGYYAAVELARLGATVVLACRDRGRGEAALKQLRTDAAGPGSASNDAELALLDLASLASIRDVAEAELARQQPLHGLINNAGVMAPPKRLETRDGFELQFGTNVLGHFALTCRLMRALEMGSGATPEDASRVVTVASIAHKRGRIHFDDLQSEKKYTPMDAYAQSKLGDLMFALELDRRLRAKMLGPVSIAVHPGVAQSALFKDVAGMFYGLTHSVIGMLLNSGPQGALPTIYAATARDAQGGAYYGPQGLMEMRGGDVGPAFVSKAAADVETQKRLWEVCAELTGVDLK
jgi:NAD(P)-dependent dehydrogenase (short-subunit alcohol dehydrogenase family)